MLKEIRNNMNDGAIDQLNRKVRNYNESLARNNPTESLHLLQEINYIRMYIHRFLIDHPSPILKALIDMNTFEGIGNELIRFGLPKAEGVMADTVLMSQLSDNSGLPTSKQWQNIITGSWFNSYFSSPSEHATSITNRLRALNEKKTNSQTMPSTENRRDYFYGLQSFKQYLLDIISFDVNDSSELKQFRLLLLQINGEIQQTGQLLESFKKRQTLKSTVIASDIYQALSQLSASQMSQLTFMLRRRKTNSSEPASKDAVISLLPCLERYNLQLLGGANNVNWKISNPETGLELVLQVGEPMENQEIIHQLEHSPVYDHFTTSFLTSSLNEDTPFSLTLTELCTGGDLRSERERLFLSEPTDEILLAGNARMQQLSSLCQLFLNQQVVHPDIKLTNFLIDNEGRVVVADKKTLVKINQDGTLTQDAITSPLNEAPESRSKEKKINAEAFMIFQLGLAYYDYLFLPEVSSDWQETPWSHRLPLDVSHPVFSSETGEKIKNLILKMTDADPQKRPRVHEVKLQLEQIHPKILSKQVSGTMPSLRENVAAFKDKLTGLRRESAVGNILADIQRRIENTSSLEELQQFKVDFTKSDDYKQLNQSSHILVHYACLLFGNTVETKAVSEMFAAQQNKLSEVASQPLQKH